MATETGRVKWFSNERGYGFIERPGGGDVFVHHSDIEGEGYKTLQTGEPVSFEVVEAEKGPKARRVCRESAPGTAAEARGQVGSREPTRSGAAPVDPSSEASGESSERNGRGRTLAQQIREKLGRRFFGE